MDHPRSLSVREDQLLPIVDDWLRQLFDDDHLDATVEALAGAQHSQVDHAEGLYREHPQTPQDDDLAMANAIAMTEAEPW